MKPLNLTDTQRNLAVVDYDVNKFVLYLDGVFMSNYSSKADLLADLKLNMFDHVAYTTVAIHKYLGSM